MEDRDDLGAALDEDSIRYVLEELNFDDRGDEPCVVRSVEDSSDS